jgi:hypothetical protein
MAECPLFVKVDKIDMTFVKMLLNERFNINVQSGSDCTLLLQAQ